MANELNDRREQLGDQLRLLEGATTSERTLIFTNDRLEYLGSVAWGSKDPIDAVLQAVRKSGATGFFLALRRSRSNMSGVKDTEGASTDWIEEMGLALIKILRWR